MTPARRAVCANDGPQNQPTHVGDSRDRAAFCGPNKALLI
jgi:hypothetical protein